MSFQHFTNVFIAAIAAIFFGISCSHRDGDELVPPDKPDTPSATDTASAYHDKTRTQPYPKISNELFINPSPLVVPQRMKTSDNLQFTLSQDSTFASSGTITSEPAAWCMYNPHRVLEVGLWYWRFRSVSKANVYGAWSKTYSFEVKNSTPQFATPAFDIFYQNTPNAYPRLFCFLDNDATDARANAKNHPEYKSLISRATTAMNADYSMANPYDKAGDIKDYMLYLYQAYYLTQDAQYRDKVVSILRTMLAKTVTDKQLFASNFGSTDIATIFILGYDIVYDQLTASDKLGAENLIMRVERYYYKAYCGYQENQIFDNHFWQHNMRVLFQGAYLLFDKGAYTSEVLPMLQYYYELWTARAPASGFNRDGVCLNGTYYYSAEYKTLQYMPMLFSYITKVDFLQHPWYLNAGKSLLYSWPPSSKSVGFGDGNERDDVPTRSRIAFADFLARELGDTYAGWYATQCRSTLLSDYEFRLYRMVRDKYPYPATTLENIAKYVWYQDAGEVAIHSNLTNTDNDFALCFRSSTFGSGSHTLADQNSFNLLYKGENVYHSTGYYLNFADAHNLMSYRHTRAHNSILVNGIGQPFSTKGYGKVLRAMGGDNITYCLGDASHAYSGISDDPMWIDNFKAAGIAQSIENGFGVTPLTLYRRHVLMLHPNVVVLYDELEASEPVRWDWLMHSPVQFSIDAAQQKLTTRYTAKNFTSVARLFSNQACTISQTDQFVVPPNLALGDPGKEYPNQWHLTAKFENCAKNRILTIIQVVPEGESTKAITGSSGAYQCGDWSIKAELNWDKKASLSVANSIQNVAFSYGSGNIIIDNVSYSRQKQSSLLYDVIDGQKQMVEELDYVPISTRAVKK